MEIGDVIKCTIIAVGANDNSFAKPIDGENINVPIIVEAKLKYKGEYKIRIKRITPNFIIGEVVNE